MGVAKKKKEKKKKKKLEINWVKSKSMNKILFKMPPSYFFIKTLLTESQVLC